MNPTRHVRRHRERGMSLIMAMLLILAFATAGGVIHAAGMRLVADHRLDIERTGRYWAAEGGVEHARAALAENPTWTGDRITIGRHEVVVSVTGEGATRDVVADVAPPQGPRVRLDVRLRLRDRLPVAVAWLRN
jgi:hypothetical protein